MLVDRARFRGHTEKQGEFECYYRMVTSKISLREEGGKTLPKMQFLKR